MIPDGRNEKTGSDLYLLFTKYHFSYSIKNEFVCKLQKIYDTKIDKSHDITDFVQKGFKK